MSHERFQASCNGKSSYATQAAAMTVINRRQKRARFRHSSHKELRRELSELVTYRCRLCHQWHVGHRS